MNNPTGYVWRKYEIGVPIFDFNRDLLDPSFRGLVIWHSGSELAYPKLNRWEGLHPAFLGFVSRGLDAPHACVYDASKAIEIMGREYLAKTWIPGADAAEAYGHFLSHFLGVWMGEKTPYFWHSSPRLLEIVKKLP